MLSILNPLCLVQGVSLWGTREVVLWTSFSASVTLNGCQHASYTWKKRMHFLFLSLLFLLYIFVPFAFHIFFLHISFIFPHFIFIILMKLVGLRRKTHGATWTPLATGQLNSCILTCPVSPGSMNWERNTVKRKCLQYALSLIPYIQHECLMARMCFKLPINFGHCKK